MAENNSSKSQLEFEAKIKEINKALEEGEKSGKPTKFNNEAFLKKMIEKYGLGANKA